MTSDASAALTLHTSALVIDTHADTAQRLLDEDYDLGGPLLQGHLNLESAKLGGLGAEFFAIWVEPRLHQERFVQRALELIDAVHQQVDKHSDRMCLALSAQDIVRAHQQGKFAALIGIEGGHAIESSLAVLRTYYNLGARYMTLTWANSNGWADSSGDTAETSTLHTGLGLTEFGEDVVHEMNRLGMMVDVSHVSDLAFERVLAVTRAPVIASHSSARALCRSPRNLSDEMLRAVAANGGVVMVNFYSAFLCETFRRAWVAFQAEREEAHQAVIEDAVRKNRIATFAETNAVEVAFAARLPRPAFSVLIDHIEHIASVAGIDHVGLGSDFDGICAMPEGINSAADLPKITASLLERGFSQMDCENILGRNLLRAFQNIENRGQQLRSET